MSSAIHTARKKSGSSQSAPPSAARSIIWGLVWTAASAFVLLLLFSCAVYSTPDPGRLVLPAALAAVYISAFIGGFVSAFLNHGDPLSCGLITGGAYFVFLILLSFVVPDGGSSLSVSGFWQSAGLHVLAVGFSLLGAFAGTSLRESGKRRKKRRK